MNHFSSFRRTLTEALINTFKSGHKCAIIGNGGSACEADHFVGELVGQYTKDHRPLPALSFNTPAVITAIANDFGYEYVFERQVRAYLTEGDLLVTLSTSGKSQNIKTAIDVAIPRGVKVISFPSKIELDVDTARCQELHLSIIHDVSKRVEEAFP